jgi:hypothetical protein
MNFAHRPRSAASIKGLTAAITRFAVALHSHFFPQCGGLMQGFKPPASVVAAKATSSKSLSVISAS